MGKIDNAVNSVKNAYNTASTKVANSAGSATRYVRGASKQASTQGTTPLTIEPNRGDVFDTSFHSTIESFAKGGAYLPGLLAGPAASLGAQPKSGKVTGKLRNGAASVAGALVGTLKFVGKVAGALVGVVAGFGKGLLDAATYKKPKPGTTSYTPFQDALDKIVKPSYTPMTDALNPPTSPQAPAASAS